MYELVRQSCSTTSSPRGLKANKAAHLFLEEAYRASKSNEEQKETTF